MTYPRLWYMNADFEMELAHYHNPNSKQIYRCPPAFAPINRRLAPRLLWLARGGDALLFDEPFADELRREAARREVELITTREAVNQSHREFTPWGWTQSAVEFGQRAGAKIPDVNLEAVARVNSKLWSHNLECELNLAIPGACASSNFEELAEAVARSCPKPDDKWVIKSPYGFAARERVLGRGAKLEAAQATWARRQLAKGETLIFQKWLDVVREYGVTMRVLRNGEIEIHGISDLQTNGAGTGYGYLLGRGIDAEHKRELESIARLVGARLYAEGYTGAAGVDALEHTRGLHLLLEVNARYTMGFIALAVERELKPREPVLWKTK